MKFKVGDKVKVIAEKRGHEFDIGEIVKIEEISDRDYKCSSLKKDELWWMGEDEFVKVKFTKSDLKDGDIITYRDGRKRTIVAESLIDEYGHEVAGLRTYDNELKNKFSATGLDIVKVERPTQYKEVFERKEEILDEVEKKYLANVIKPFRHEIKIISKRSRLGNSSICYIKIWLKNNDTANLPDFKENSMYKGMEPNREYSLKELGLE